MYLDDVHNNLLNLVQSDFPLVTRPYADLGLRLDITENDVIHRVEQLKTAGFIREIGPLLNPRILGYKTTLVGMQVATDSLDSTTKPIICHPGVSHCYEREHRFNLWFTLAVPSKTSIERELKQLINPINAEAVVALPVTKVFKQRAYFAMGVCSEAQETKENWPGIYKIRLSLTDRELLNEIQQDLPLIEMPFTVMMTKLGMNEEEFFGRCRSLLRRGVIRRFSASVNHHRVGLKANAMSCWLAPPNQVEDAGRKLALLKEVSHCYERRTNRLWKHNLFAMIHGYSKEECLELISKLSIDMGLTDYELLFSTREFKKSRVKYLV